MNWPLLLYYEKEHSRRGHQPEQEDDIWEDQGKKNIRNNSEDKD